MRVPRYFFLLAGALLLAACAQTTAPITPGTTAQAVTERCSDNPQNPFKNCGFETGDFTGWVTQDLSAPYRALTVAAESSDFLVGTVGTSEGGFSAQHGFDGNGPGHIKICQDVTVPNDRPLLTFDYQANWDLATFGATLDRTFRVTFSTSASGEIFSHAVLTARAGTKDSTGILNGSVDLSDVAGTTGRFCFDWEVPESSSGPAAAMLDNVNLTRAVQNDTYTINAEGVSSKNVLYGVRVGQGMSGPAHSGRVSVGGKRVVGGKFRGGQSAKVLELWGGKRMAVVANGKSTTPNPGGGQLQFVFKPFFTGEVTVKELTLYNVVKPGVTVNLYKGRKLVKQVPVPTGAVGAPVTVKINEPGISIVSVTARFPIAVDDLVFEVPQTLR